MKLTATTRKLAIIAALATAFFISTPSLEANSYAAVDFKKCVESSKLGKKEKENFEALKKRMEDQLLEKEKNLKEMATKLEDTDYLDSLSPEGETELKRKFRTLNQEMSGMQNQFLQLLQQTNVKILQKMHESVEKAASDVAKEKRLDVVFNKEACFFLKPELDISDLVIQQLDKDYKEDSST